MHAHNIQNYLLIAHIGGVRNLHNLGESNGKK